MTLQPAPGAGIVQRDAHTIPPREPRDGRRIGTPTSAEEPYNGMPVTGLLDSPTQFEPWGLRGIAARADGSVYFTETDTLFGEDPDLYRYRPSGSTGVIDVVRLPAPGSGEISALERDGKADPILSGGRTAC